MSFTIKNKYRGLISFTYNNGDPEHLAPGESSKPVSETETKNNAKIERLLKEGMIEIKSASDQSSAEGETSAMPRRKPKP